ncbi:EAL domain-containing protein (putative c-di-GMP-specific phosphodiesterase class I) [Marinobacter pelagius]|uniref:EAL domain-containing protein (Putative c-di-GMP-specific phosphodiesterase class I) n=1 Tax=Marinobacter pelagius TaxID=379482 RepID=A0A366GDM1_9GAMM|nr:EAL domain-containing protein [Marinobacter pelagius]RBP25044.1 EAL domain-containing protein (putative c-di-GMP-specific phosphodiesterase class I) [Marinobacter pelagius]
MDTQTLATRTDFIRERLPEALDNNQLELHFQPKVNLLTGQTCGYEALSRWRDNHLGQIPPSEFVPIAEGAGLATRLDRLVMHKAISFLKTTRKRKAPSISPLSINVSAQHFEDPSLVSFLMSTLDHHGIAGKDIELELTETSVIRNMRAVSDCIGQLAEIGIPTVLDDFGTGFCTLSYLTKLPVKQLKIDKSFVDAIDTTEGKSIVESVLNMARGYELSVTAEGIETESQRRILCDMGCQMGQGYLFSQPITKIELINGLGRHHYTKPCNLGLR